MILCKNCNLEICFDFPTNADQQQHLESPTSTVSFSEMKESTKIEFVGSSTGLTLIKEPENDWISSTIHEFATTQMSEGIEEGFTGLLLGDSIDRSFSADKNESAVESSGGDCNNYYEDSKNYLDSIFSFVDPSPSDSPSMF